MPTFTRDKTTETKDFNRYTYYSYELRRQVKISLIFRKIRLFYIGYCIIFLVAAYPYLNDSRLAATGLIVLSTAYGILRYFRESRMEREWPRDFWLDLFDYIIIGILVYITGGLSSFFYIAYTIPILAATIRFNIKAGLSGLGLAILFTGLSALAGKINQGVYYPMAFYLIFGLGTMVFAAWAINGLMGDETKLRKELYNSSVTDPLTGLYHCGYARERINEEIMRCRRDGSSFSIIFIDLDHFKEVNDRYGHLIGDKVIRHVAAVLQSSVRRGDILSRYGGDEFLLLLPGTESKDAELTLQQLLRAVQSHPYYVNGLPLHLGLSGGTAEYPCEGQNPEQLLQLADQKMYCKKS